MRIHRTAPNAPSSSLISRRGLALLVFIDLLFFPRLLFAFGIPFSLLIVLLSIASDRLKLRNILCLLMLGVSMFTSVLFGTLTGENMVPYESIKRVLQLITIIFYALYRVDFNEIRLVMIKLLRVFYLYLFCAMLLFFVAPKLYEQLIVLIYPEALDQLLNNLLNRRFPYVYSDPNSAGYLICFTLVAYFALERQKFWGILCGSMATAAVVATQSRGAYVALLLIFIHLLISSHIRVRTKVAVLVFTGLAVSMVAPIYREKIEQAYTVFESRFEHEEDLSGGRLDKYAYWLQNLNLLPFGTGYHLQRHGVEFKPHSDLIRLNLSYGVLALPFMLYFVFPRRRSQILLFVVFLIPFLINTVIDDYRLLPVYLLLFMLLSQLQTNGLSRINIRRSRLKTPPLQLLEKPK